MEELKVLLKEGEKVEPVYTVPEYLQAPVKAGDVVGKVQYKFGDEVLEEFSIYAARSVKKIDYKWCLTKAVNRFLCGN